MRKKKTTATVTRRKAARKKKVARKKIPMTRDVIPSRLRGIYITEDGTWGDIDSLILICNNFNEENLEVIHGMSDSERYDFAVAAEGTKLTPIQYEEMCAKLAHEEDGEEIE
jgi:hypothetical protein